MGFNRRKMEADRKAKADAEAAAKRATNTQVLEDAEGLIGPWNERQAKRMPSCSHRRSAPRSLRAIGTCGYAARRAGRQAALTYAVSIVTPTQR